ncbi:MAG TPA: BrnA antitoxin family protein [Candidatus Binatia bacterium]|nr:BrnA antitoxin family protein [Candidatus Binatia bacterium]
MANKIKYTNAPPDVARALKHAVPVKDFLPSPDKLILKQEKEKITIALDKRSVDLFRYYAKKHDAKYQTMINEVVGAYADEYLVNK